MRTSSLELHPIESWALSASEIEWLHTKPAKTWFSLAVPLKFYSLFGRFPASPDEIPESAVIEIGGQLGLQAVDKTACALSDRKGQRDRAEILSHLGIREPTGSDLAALEAWLRDDISAQGKPTDEAMALICRWCLTRKMRAPSPSAAKRLIHSARATFEAQFLSRLADALPDDTVRQMEASLEHPDDSGGFNNLKADPGRVALASVMSVADRLAFIRRLDLPRHLLCNVHAKLVDRWTRRVSQETAWEMRRHKRTRRMGLYAIFLMQRQGRLTDGLVDLLVDTVHKMAGRAERRVSAAILDDIDRIYGKERILARIAEAAIARPDGRIRDVIFPIASEDKLRAIQADYHARHGIDRRVHETMRSSYAGHYRRMVPQLLDVLDFRSNNASHRPVLEALETIADARDNNRRVLDPADGLPLDGVMSEKQKRFVVGSEGRINLVDYELCTLIALRDRIRSKEIWIVGAERHRNPDADLPQDFAGRRERYYQELGLPVQASAFTARVQAGMEDELRRLNAALPGNETVRLRTHGPNRICLSPMAPQPEPEGLIALKTEIGQRWPMLALIDLLKEAALDTGFLDVFKTSGDRVVLPRTTLQHRLLLCLYGLGTNAGLKRVSAGVPDVSYKELLHVHRRFIDANALREAARRVANATLAIRDPAIWGEAGTACASDSKKFGAWDRNLMTEWHVRYRGPGIMIYWHVERRSTCIYSQLKRCSSSEVAAMIEGVLRHCTDLDIQRQYVDSHGQSEVAFAFCHLLGFDLAPRLKAIARQKLALPDTSLKSALPNLAPVLAHVIDWELIERQYDEMVKYAAALKTRTAGAEAILRRFNRTASLHPTYKALMELGKAVKTVFLCRYLRDPAFRREIHESLNVVENWNSANSFVFFGKGHEFATNRLDAQEMSVLALHLLQNCLVYVNTRMMQSVLGEPHWQDRLSPADHRALSPLGYANVNPYGEFRIDMERRMDFGQCQAA